MTESAIARLLAEMTPGSYGIWALVVMVLIAYFRVKPQLDTIRVSSDVQFRTDLMARVHAVEEQMAAQSIAHEAAMREERLTCERDMAVLRGEIAKLRRQISAFEVTIARTYPQGIPTDMQRQLDQIRRDGDIQ
jgi:hypothetical protein